MEFKAETTHSRNCVKARTIKPFLCLKPRQFGKQLGCDSNSTALKFLDPRINRRNANKNFEGGHVSISLAICERSVILVIFFIFPLYHLSIQD